MVAKSAERRISYKNACYSVCQDNTSQANNKRSLSGRKQRDQVARSFPNRYLFSYTDKVTSLFLCQKTLYLSVETKLYNTLKVFVPTLTIIIPVVRCIGTKMLLVRTVPFARHLPVTEYSA